MKNYFNKTATAIATLMAGATLMTQVAQAEPSAKKSTVQSAKNQITETYYECVPTPPPPADCHKNADYISAKLDVQGQGFRITNLGKNDCAYGEGGTLSISFKVTEKATGAKGAYETGYKPTTMPVGGLDCPTTMNTGYKWSLEEKTTKPTVKEGAGMSVMYAAK
jgi:hypothetical protein